MHGLGFSFVYATAIGAAQKWFPKNRKGFVGSIVLSGMVKNENVYFMSRLRPQCPSRLN